MIEAPILFIIFNRPRTTEIVFERIKKLQPKVLYIAADGPRTNNDKDVQLCTEARRITENINWKCKVKRLYRVSNLGCGKAVSGAISWFFKNVTAGVIIEDDCLFDESFYRFTCKMLDKFKDDTTVMHISGDNFLSKNMLDSSVYYFSKYVHVWGWATWRYSWNKYDYHMKNWNNKNLLQKINFIEGSLWEKLYWTSKFDSVSYKITDTWDYQWIYTVMENKGRAIVPGTNLVSNIGFGNEASHTSGVNHYMSELKTKSMDAKIHLSDPKDNTKLDEYESKKVFKFKSISTILYFGYFSIFCMIYNKFRK